MASLRPPNAGCRGRTLHEREDLRPVADGRLSRQSWPAALAFPPSMWSNDPDSSPHGARVMNRGFSLIELLVAVAIIALLVAIMLPALGRARRETRVTLCGGRLQQLGQGVFSFAASHDGKIPRGPEDA